MGEACAGHAHPADVLLQDGAGLGRGPAHGQLQDLLGSLGTVGGSFLEEGEIRGRKRGRERRREGRR